MTPSDVNAMLERYHHYLREFETALGRDDHIMAAVNVNLAIHAIVWALVDVNFQASSDFINRMQYPTIGG